MNATAKKKLITGLAIAGGVVLLTRKGRPPLVRGQDAGFDWQGQHVQGGQGSAITNLGAPKDAKTDYVLVATAMKNYALNTVKTYAGTNIPGLPYSYAATCLNYWFQEAGRLLGAGPTTRELSTPLQIVTLGLAEQTASKIDPFDKTRGFWQQSSPIGQLAFNAVFGEWKAFHDRIPNMVYLKAWTYPRAWNVAAPYEFASQNDANAFWDAMLRVGIGFDVSKVVPGTSQWDSTIAALKAAARATGGAASTAVTAVATTAGRAAGAAGKGIASAILSSPTAIIIVGGLGYLAYQRLKPRSA